jgi:hypothetical protein
MPVARKIHWPRASTSCRCGELVWQDVAPWVQRLVKEAGQQSYRVVCRPACTRCGRKVPMTVGDLLRAA